MLKFIITYLSFFCIGLLFSLKSYSQNLVHKDNSEYYLLFDEVVGIQNTKIYNGTEIIQGHRVSNEKNEYFFEDSFVSSTVIFDGQPYFNVDLNYNIFEDLIIIRLKNDIGKIAFKPVQEKVEGFVFGPFEFTNFTSLNSPEFNGFYQILEDNEEFTLLKKHKLKRISNLKKKMFFYEFIPVEGEYYIQRVGTLSEINSKSDWLNLFPNHDSAIRKFFRKNRKLRKQYPEEFIQNLFFSTTN
ncbi:hypothetical protein [Gillisia sp. JM1]|uniref:hypothetical protein n=1 Tax=Gillisia sp. JM1 TaxID=1283286 RepID=UPI00041C8241|nr:hypothetical protein [Gillisia sp. JM1]